MSQLPPPPEPTPPLPEQAPTPRPFRRSRDDKKLAGLCGGFAQYYGWDPTLVRLLTVVVAFVTSGALALAYLVGWIIVPEGPTTQA
ncbi:MAG TPA: PspC domain-containing protein [Nocardioidaceae bacterium]|jgi:phage shock protein PspC (stress-responsive transcriptional regulator)|nr:PspC domain-containing protein [Nocardioidaceae bacterium]